MGFGKKSMVFLFIVVVEVSMASGVVYIVGDSGGWTNVGNVDYKAWSSNKTFHVGDTIGNLIYSLPLLPSSFFIILFINRYFLQKKIVKNSRDNLF